MTFVKPVYSYEVAISNADPSVKSRTEHSGLGRRGVFQDVGPEMLGAEIRCNLQLRL